ncbi:DUF4402 domain-containing protein [Sphingomonas cavernae]|uniref:DUF4402 domain-containing protein n=1 Tax=Sphingomonas cavernae TaxID=2320861 RepID=A0A418WPX4_9SPHN|nr:DUF4402 domain-containing protein [Sphingomonas cavernae]
MWRRAGGLSRRPEAACGGTHPGTSRDSAYAVSLLSCRPAPGESRLENVLGFALRTTLLLALAGIPGIAFAAQTPGEASATMVRPLTLIKTEDLDFGSISAGPTAGTVRINPATGARTTTGGAIAAGGAPTRATFVGASQLGIALNVQISASPTLVRAGGGTMTTALEVDGGTGWRLFTGTGPHTFHVGGQLNVGTNQTAGSYAGQFTLTVNYF